MTHPNQIEMVILWIAIYATYLFVIAAYLHILNVAPQCTHIRNVIGTTDGIQNNDGTMVTHVKCPTDQLRTNKN